MIHCHHRRRGMALILALSVTAIVSALLSGILLLSVSHLSLSNTNSSYANALNLAEAGINWELWKISRDPTAADQSPVTMEYPTGSGRFFTVHVEAYPSGGTWIPPRDLCVIGTGTVDGVSRTVRFVTAGATDYFGHYALFGINELSVGGSAVINGASGTNGLVDLQGTAASFNGNFWYCGTAGGEDVTDLVTGEVFHSPLPEYWPTVNDFAELRAAEKDGATPPQTIDYFKTHNDNDQIVDGLGQPVEIKDLKIDLHTFKNHDTLVLPPGDYYFEKLNLPSNNTLQINSADGPVNIWLGPEGGIGKADTINGEMVFTSQDPNRFHLYVGSKRALEMNGTMDFYGHIFAYNGPDEEGDYYGEVEINGDGTIWGSVIAYDVSRTSGNATISFQTTGGGESDPGDFWGVQFWEEVNPA